MPVETLYPASPRTVPAEVTQLDSAYRLRVVGMIGGLFLFLVVYVLFIIAAGLVAYWLLNLPMPKSFFGPNADQVTNPYNYDLEKARALLAEAGYPDGGFALDYLVQRGDEQKIIMFQVLQSEAAKLGIELRLFEMDWPVLLDRVSNWGKNQDGDVPALIDLDQQHGMHLPRGAAGHHRQTKLRIGKTEGAQRHVFGDGVVFAIPARTPEGERRLPNVAAAELAAIVSVRAGVHQVLDSFGPRKLRAPVDVGEPARDFPGYARRAAGSAKTAFDRRDLLREAFADRVPFREVLPGRQRPLEIAKERLGGVGAAWSIEQQSNRNCSRAPLR